jgi:hypothetical protein
MMRMPFSTHPAIAACLTFAVGLSLGIVVGSVPPKQKAEKRIEPTPGRLMVARLDGNIQAHHNPRQTWMS